jgi:SAM-dependent methyltransferase
MTQDYDALPYRSLPFAESRPDHLGAVAALFGLFPTSPARARVLELGCASGGNLIPLAADAPEGRFLGIDLTARHVADGQETIARLGLENVEIRQGDIATADFGDAQFDYVICHGVYSWVPEAARDAILRLAARHLAPDGVLYVSYNIYPGWHLRSIVRDICLYHAGEGGPPQHRVARARWALEHIAEGQDDQTPYGAARRSSTVDNPTATSWASSSRPTTRPATSRTSPHGPRRRG